MMTSFGSVLTISRWRIAYFPQILRSSAGRAPRNRYSWISSLIFPELAREASTRSSVSVFNLWFSDPEPPDISEPSVFNVLALDEVHIVDDGGQRCLDIVGHVRDQVGLQAFALYLFGKSCLQTVTDTVQSFGEFRLRLEKSLTSTL